MSSQPIEPLRIQKGSPTKSPSKLNAASNRPLSELNPMAIRRNSPSFPKGGILQNDSSPFAASPSNVKSTASPRLFWQGRESGSPCRENQISYENQSPVLTKRSSIEKLKQASRVKNSNMFAKEQSINYDPSKPIILDRPLASGRPLTTQVQGNAFSGQGIQGLRKEDEKSFSTKALTEMQEADNNISSENSVIPLPPSKTNTSPAKSSLSKRTGAHARYGEFDPETGIWVDDDPSDKQLPEGKYLHRHAKSVTFDQAPPQVNEYEMTTPDPSSIASGSREGSYDSVEDDEDLSFERGSSLDRDESFDASLEDTDKTPVVLPEDWRFMSPDIANTELAKHEEDVFADDDYGSPAPAAQPGLQEHRPHQTSLNSVDSNGQPRPLPPLPQNGVKNTDLGEGFSSAIERMSNAQRSLPSPPQAASISKSDIRRMSGGAMSLEDRLRLMMLKEQEQEKSEAEKQRERKMRRAGSKESSPTRETFHQQDTTAVNEEKYSEPALVNQANAVSQISRESILRRLRSQQDLHNSDTGFETARYDPDIPIPSLEDPTQTVSQEVHIKQEDEDDTDLYAIPDLYSNSIHTESESGESLSQYSQISFHHRNAPLLDEGQETPRAQSPAADYRKKVETFQRPSLPDFLGFGEESSFDLGLSSYMTPPTEPTSKEISMVTKPAEPSLPDLSALRQSIQRPFTPEDKFQPPRFSMSFTNAIAEPGTPESVIRHSTEEPTASKVSEPESTMKVATFEVKARQSFTLLNTETMIEERRGANAQEDASSQSSDTFSNPQLMSEGECPETSEDFEATGRPASAESGDRIPFESTGESGTKKRVSSLVQLEIPRDQSDENLGLGLEKEFDRVLEAQKVEFELSLQRLYYPFNGRFPSSEYPDAKDMMEKNPLENVPFLPRPCSAQPLRGGQFAGGHSYAFDKSLCANRSPRRQRGYLMRQNTKVVVASERPSQEDHRPASAKSSAPSETAASDVSANEVQVSPRKTSQPTWTAEPWNGKSRRKSIRVGGEKSPVKRKPLDGTAPPLPGQASNVQESLAEDEILEDEGEDLEDGAERGRLFVKVIGVKDLDLPLPEHERTSFALTLDNGLHCVTTAWLDLAKNAPIGQEFELVVLNDLEFQLTLQMKLEEPKIVRPASPSKILSSPKKPGAFGRLFGSPKKRKESEAKTQEETARRPVTPPSAYEMVQGLVAKDGSFARAYVALSEHEKQAYGRPYAVDVMCFNEWAMEEVQLGSSRSKKGMTQLQQRPPYQIGKLELQLLYVPKPKGSKDEDMPKSMNGAVRELREAETKMGQQTLEFEGHLSQQGGDCPYWRRRFFKLAGTKLTAYHEATLQPRATINLAKAAKLIDDKSTLTQKETSAKGGGRRKSAFAEEEEGYMFVEEGFRIRFANGEVIDFYADSSEAKDEWMKVLSQVVGKGPSGSAGSVKPWAEAVLRREKSAMAKEKKLKPTAPPKVKAETLTREETVVRNPNAARGALPFKQADSQAGSIPSPTRAAPRPQGHMRTESYQPQSGSRSQANSPVKKRMTPEERRQKTRSLIDLHFK